ncbi:NAD(P)H-binding protein [Nocardia sp. NBC_01327]|uniref:NAD(P)H-binding protein n=1 Tax=Nocardia sp. NBC_01327 TaxID=2903593 RepID=UPI002E120153|nr:NAD(P)H-binding protein [Nocardia sp. NBC_01327]
MLTVVFGASGNVGRHVAAGLNSVGAQVRLTSRSPDAAALPAGADVVFADLDRAETLPAALDGAQRVFLYAKPEGIDGFVAAAESAGVQHVVLLSSAAVATAATDNPIALIHSRVESALEASRLAWTFIRPGMFASNTVRWWQEPIRGERTVRLPYPDARTTPVHEKDLAAIALAALTEPGHEGRAYLAHGPEALTLRQQVRDIGAAIGRDITVEESSVDQARAELEKTLPPFVAEAFLSGWKAAADEPPQISTTIEDVIGRPALTFAQWARDHADDFR